MSAVAKVLALLLLIAAPAFAAEQADLILHNGKIVTVDEQFTIGQAIAVKGERVMATGRNGDIAKLAGPGTRKIDLKGKTVIPGLIDNHAHFMRAAEYWHQEIRLDGVTSRKQALEMIARKAKESKLAGIHKLKEVLQRLLLEHAAELEAVPSEQNVAVVVHLFNLPSEQSDELPTQLVIETSRQALLDAQSKQTTAQEFAKSQIVLEF